MSLLTIDVYKIPDIDQNLDPYLATQIPWGENRLKCKHKLVHDTKLYESVTTSQKCSFIGY